MGRMSWPRLAQESKLQTHGVVYTSVSVSMVLVAGVIVAVSLTVLVTKLPEIVSKPASSEMVRVCVDVGTVTAVATRSSQTSPWMTCRYVWTESVPA